MTWYRKIRNEILIGGAEEAPAQETKDARWVGLVVLGLLVWLGVENPWALVFVFGLVISVFLHEVGHFVTARRSGMKVTQFYMGFGPKVWSIQRGEVEYGVRAFPIGAFVRIIGMSSEDNEVEPEDESRTYRAQSYPKRMLVITAGSLMHLVIAASLIVGIYSFAGRYQETGQVRIMEAPAADTAAAAAGLQSGDLIVAIDGESMRTRDQFSRTIIGHEPGDQIEILIERGGNEMVLAATLGNHPADETKSTPYLGVYTQSRDYQTMNPLRSLWWGFGDIVDMAASSARGVVTALNPINSVKHLTNSDSVGDESRPTTVVGATQVGGVIGRDDGLKGVLLLLAAVNVFVGVFNMFPMLPFDGGHAAVATYERLRSRRGRRYFADISKMVPVTFVVVALVLFLFATGLYLDITDPLG